jgi:hypothetical protein
MFIYVSLIRKSDMDKHNNRKVVAITTKFQDKKWKITRCCGTKRFRKKLFNLSSWFTEFQLHGHSALVSSLYALGV